MAKPVTDKLGIRVDMRTIFINAPDEALSHISSPILSVKKRLTGKFDYIHLFVKSQAEFKKQFPKLMNHLHNPGMLWVSWPKAGLKNTDLNIKIVIKLGYDCGLVESKAISIDATWSALKFTWPKKGIVYNNSYGKLPQ